MENPGMVDRKKLKKFLETSDGEYDEDINFTDLYKDKFQ